jgi:hypothetical protein
MVPLAIKNCDQLLRLSDAKPHSPAVAQLDCFTRIGVAGRISICFAEPHSLQVLGARRSVHSPWVARGRSFPLPRTGRPFRGLMGRHGGFWIGEVPIVIHKPGGDFAMNYGHFFSAALARLHAERRCRVFSSASPDVSRTLYGIPRTAHGRS